MSACSYITTHIVWLPYDFSSDSPDKGWARGGDAGSFQRLLTPRNDSASGTQAQPIYGIRIRCRLSAITSVRAKQARKSENKHKYNERQTDAEAGNPCAR